MKNQKVLRTACCAIAWAQVTENQLQLLENLGILRSEKQRGSKYPAADPGPASLVDIRYSRGA